MRLTNTALGSRMDWRRKTPRSPIFLLLSVCNWPSLMVKTIIKRDESNLTEAFRAQTASRLATIIAGIGLKVKNIVSLTFCLCGGIPVTETFRRV